MERPKITDPAEYALIKQIYFKDDRSAYEELDQLERLERMEAKHRQMKRSSR